MPKNIMYQIDRGIFFPWNRDTTKLSRLIQPLFDKVLRINGYEPKKILKQTPETVSFKDFT